MLNKDTNIIVLTGAGISTDSGLATFREKGGIWDRYDPDKVCTLSGNINDPVSAWKFHSEIYNSYINAKPNDGHRSLVKLEQYLNPGNLVVITQNIDGLHQKAGSSDVIEMHGTIFVTRCNSCSYKEDTSKTINRFNALNQKHPPTCPRCKGLLRPDVTMFEEIPQHYEKVMSGIRWCNIFLQIGTSGNVSPANTMLILAEKSGAKTIVINKDSPVNMTNNTKYYSCDATKNTSKYIDEIIENGE